MERALTLSKEAAARARNEADVSYPAQVAELAYRMRRTKEYREAVEDLEARFPNEMATTPISPRCAQRWMVSGSRPRTRSKKRKSADCRQKPSTSS